MRNTTTQETVREIIEIRNQRNPNWAYDSDGFRRCPVCGNLREIQLSEDDPKIFGELRDVFVKCKLPVRCVCDDLQ